MILALEFSSEKRGIALMDDGRILGRTWQSDPVSTRPLRLIAECLATAKRRVEDIRTVAVGLGPGSYTGVRIAISVAQGLSLARPVRISAHSSFDVLARAPENQGPAIQFFAADAQRGEFAVSERNAHGWEAPQLMDAAALRRKMLPGTHVLGPGMSRLLTGAQDAHPDPGILAELAHSHPNWIHPSDLAPIYLRAASFVKAPPGRIIAEMTDGG